MSLGISAARTKACAMSWRMPCALRSPGCAACGSKKSSSTEEFWALKNVTFQVQPGESNFVLTLPAGLGSAGQALLVNADGNLYWGNQTGAVYVNPGTVEKQGNYLITLMTAVLCPPLQQYLSVRPAMSALVRLLPPRNYFQSAEPAAANLLLILLGRY